MQHDHSRRLNVSTATQGHLQHLWHNSTQSSCQLPTQGDAAWGMLGGLKLGTWTLAAHSRNFRGSFAKFHWRFPGEAVCKHLHSQSEQLQVVASLSGLRLLRLLVYDSGDRNRRILYALSGLGTEILRLQSVTWGHFRPPALPEDCLVFLFFVSKENV